jgi:hypothetical protein
MYVLLLCFATTFLSLYFLDLPNQQRLVINEVIPRLNLFRLHLPVRFDQLFSNALLSSAGLSPDALIGDLTATEQLVSVVGLK